jgi:hypothetical protein
VLRIARTTLVVSATLALAGCELFAGLDAPTLVRDGGPAADGAPAAVLEVAMRGNVLGHVTSMPAGIDCPGRCRASFAVGTAVTLRADPPGEDVASGKRFVGWDGDGCGSADPACAMTVAAEGALVGARFYWRTNVAFVTSTTSDGALGGLEPADATCTQLAAQAGLPPGPYVAWLSVHGGAEAKDRLGTGSGWVRTDGKPFARSRIDLLAGHILYPLRLDERGRDIVDAQERAGVFTATAPDGTGTFGDCQGWTNGSCGSDCVFPADSGSPGGGTVRWTQGLTGGSCASAFHLYCLGTGASVPPPALPAPTAQQAKLWLSSVPYQPGMGNVDDLCRNDARAFGFDEPSAHAIHAGPGSSPAIWLLVSPGNLPPTYFVRPDGVVVADSLTDLFDGHGIRAPINVTPDKVYQGGDDVRVWLGASDMNQIATDTVCDNLTDGLGATLTADAALSTISVQISGCTDLHRVWCGELKLEPL